MATFSKTDYENLRASGVILRDCLAMLKTHAVAGVTTMELDKMAEDFIVARGGSPSFKNYKGYKYTLCTSINDESVHGMPRTDRMLHNGDIVSLDCGVRFPAKGGMCTDSARTFAVGKITPKAQKLIDVTEQCFNVAVDGLHAGCLVGQIGQKIEKFINGKYGIVDTYFGHGIGKLVHDDPLIPNFDVSKSQNPRLTAVGARPFRDGEIICIEPMINIGTPRLVVGKDGWTAVTADGELACHYENTLIIWNDRVEIIT